MASSSYWKLNALIKKNLLAMRRNILSTIAEIFFPIALMCIVLVLRKVFKIKYYRFEKEESNDDYFFLNKSKAYIRPEEFGAPLNPLSLTSEKWKTYIVKRSFFFLCNEAMKTPRNKIALVTVPNEIKNAIIEISQYSDSNATITEDNFTDFSSNEELDKYVKSDDYGSVEKPPLCYGIQFSENNNKYEYSLHYFDSPMDEYVQDVPDGRVPANDEFQDGPDMESYVKYISNSYIEMLKIITDYILRKETGKSDAYIDFGMMANKYKYYREDPFGMFVGYIVPFFIIIAYMSPLCLYVLRMVTEKESKAKEGMKIMGMNEGTYFLSYFIQYFIVNIFYSIGNGIIIHFVFTHVPFGYLFLTYFLWGLDIFALAFFFQSFIDRTRVALIISLLVYFVMLFMSMAVINESVKIGLKVLVTIFPPVCIELGIVVYGKFESHFKDFTSKHVNKKYTNYKISYMFMMLTVDFFFYLFLGYYLQNIVSHEFGISKPFYFLCTKTYWCGKEKKKKVKAIQENLSQNRETANNHINNTNSQNESNSIDQQNDLGIRQSEDPNFESEELYKDKTGKKDSLKVRKLVKQFDDGKVAVNGVSLNLYRDEIFALLGHNGAGKSTMISMLCGLYDSTSGSAFYDGVDILEGNQMEIFRTKLGICPQHDVLFDDLTIEEHLSMFSTFKGVASNDVQEEVEKILKDFQLEDMKNIVAKNLSAGQRRKLSIAISIIGGSEVIFLDEPSSGMDITSRRNLWEILKRMTEKRIIILTTHYMEEASVLGNRIGIINSGEMKCIGTPLFLIERFGKFMSLNITKEENANNDDIIEFVTSKANDIEYEVLSEEILFRIPKTAYSNENLTLSENSLPKEKKNKNNTPTFKIEEFFKELDNKCKELKIKTYSASMPTLEDVFLNVAAEDTMKIQGEHRKFSQTNESNDKILFEQDFREDFTQRSKFCNDLTTCLKKRWFQVYRDMKSLFLEILCPILLILIGLCVSQVKFNFSSSPQVVSIGILGPDTIFYGSKENKGVDSHFLQKPYNCSYEEIITDTTYTDDAEAIFGFYQAITEKNDATNFGSLYILNADKTNQQYTFIEFINTVARQGAPFFSHYFLKQMLDYATGKDLDITFTHYPMPLTAELQSHADQTSNSTVVFFVAVAFSLIPANFVTIIVKERLNNSKHLMRISGINLFAYWLSNFIMELIKYYFTAGICVILIWIFGFYKKYFVIFYLVYGPPMVLSTYIISFFFDNESSAQNGVILLNFLIGALGSSVVLIFRGWDTLREVGKGLAYAFSLLPSFSFAYAFTSLLNRTLIYIADEPETYYLLLADGHKIIELKYTGQQVLYLCIELVVYGVLLVIVEKIQYTFNEPPNNDLISNSSDQEVLNEIEKSKKYTPKIEIHDENDKNFQNQENENQQYAVQLQNLRRSFDDPEGKFCSGEQKLAISNLSFCLEYGECFGLLGVNGAGKTTTFRCITQEYGPSNGRIYVNGYDIGTNFSKVSQMFGYCPQFDAIFEYMTVYENLEFYANLKGVKTDLLNRMIHAMIEEMSLTEFPNKLAGRLSGGNKRKLSVAISMICNPPIILLDEPSTGMDPEARRFMWAVIHKISTRRKKSAVIMTTHSMDEAETLCKRMGIMVNGELVCLGSAQNIKDKYGYGFEVDLRIKPLSEEKFNEFIEKYSLDKNLIIKKDNLKEILDKCNKGGFYEEFGKGKMGEKINLELEIKGRLKIRQLLSWIFFVTNSLKLIKKAKENFEEIILTEFIDNNFLFKIKKSENGISIGFLFGLFESLRNECHVTEYSIQQTSLEQIFNQFAARQGKREDQEIEMKTEIKIDDTLLKRLLTE